MYQAGLVLEGGGMKGVYTAGVLDFFLKEGLEFSSVYGVSAGACSMCSYLSKQKGRAYHVFVDYLDNKKYCGVQSLLFTGDFFNVDMCYDLIPRYLNPYDYQAYDRYEGKAYAVVTNIRTGKPEYLPVRDLRRDMEKIRASSSLPLVSRNVRIGGKVYLDGGLSDSIPIRKSIRDQNLKNVVILTKETGFRRKPSSHMALLRLRYAKYPRIYALMKNRHIRYNATLDYLSRQERLGKAFVIRPSGDSGVGRIEKDREKLEALYLQGYKDGESCFGKLKAYLEK